MTGPFDLNLKGIDWEYLSKEGKYRIGKYIQNINPKIVQKYPWTKLENFLAWKFFYNLHYRVHYSKKNAFFLILGEPGSGKSYTALKFAELLDPQFTVDNVVFKPSEFLDVLDTVDHVGTAIIWDEGGVGLDAREWQSLSNRAISKVLQSFRGTSKGRVYLIFATPDQSFIDRRVKKLLSFMGEARKSANIVRLYLRKVKYNRFTSKEYYWNPRITIGNNMLLMNSFRMGLPSEKLVKAYEKKSIPSKDDIRKEMEELLGIDAVKDSTMSINEIKEHVKNNIKDYTSPRGTIDADLIYLDFKGNITEKQARMIKKLLERELRTTA